MSSPRQHLSTRDLFAAGATKIHVNTPLHRGNTPLHDHDFIEIAVVRAGQALHRQLDGLSPTTPGTVWLLMPGQWHAWERCYHLRLANICFAPELLTTALAHCHDDPLMAAWWQQDRPLRMQLDQEALQAVSARIDDLAQHCRDGGPLTISLLGAVLATLRNYAPRVHSPGRGDRVMRAIMDAFVNDPARPWTLDLLAQQHGLERSYLGRRFRRVTGMSPLAWLGRHRCELAAIRLLCSSDPIAAIGKSVGWEDPNYFSRRFRQEMGVSPSTYRSQLPLPPTLPREADWVQWR
ncbi:MAG: AraC family transcriptional regulator [Planctomycetota bacterium]|nr:MAG: AraC family transcriptional regulator [Planctomycetota bacterium]